LQRVVNRLTTFVSLNAQWVNQNVDSSEEFTLGGPGGLRAYPIGEASGDEGWLANIELRYDVPRIAFGDLQVLAFIDTGHVVLEDRRWGAAPNVAGTNSYGLTGAGLGANFTQGTRYSVRTAWAKQLGRNDGRNAFGHNTDGRNDSNHFWLQALYWFN
jgi:hemolysin activation/secretion protein